MSFNQVIIEFYASKKLNSCASSNPPFVLSGIPLSSQPEQVQGCIAPFGLTPLGSAVSFQLKNAQAICHHRLSLYLTWIAFLFRSQLSPANHR